MTLKEDSKIKRLPADNLRPAKEDSVKESTIQEAERLLFFIVWALIVASLGIFGREDELRGSF